jgi:prepilin-type N-terminal cleavage/methylation domain-containing protein/prepilin-type processing-associated H-X9-DG protein
MARTGPGALWCDRVNGRMQPQPSVRVSQWGRIVRPMRAGFTLTELLVVIGILLVLLSILLPTIGKARSQANATTCSANLRSIGQAFQAYLNLYDHYTPPFRNNSTWDNPSVPNKFINPNDPNAYWGVIYAVTAGVPKEAFRCPSNQQKTNAQGYPNEYINYGLNGWGDEYSGLSDSERMGPISRRPKGFFESVDKVVLFQRNNGVWSNALGRNVTALRYPSQTIFAQDAWEAVLDGGHNGDTYASADSSNRGRLTEYPGHDIEYLRHDGYSNAVFIDGHVERLSKIDQTDERYYTGCSWDLPRSY